MGKETIVSKSLPAVVVLYYTASERKICLEKENKTIKYKIKKMKPLTIITLATEKGSKYSFLLEQAC